MMGALSKIVAIIFVVIIKYQQHNGIEFSNRIHHALTAICHYALHQASSNTKFRLTQEEMEDIIFDERNLDGSNLLKLGHKKAPIQALKLAIMKSVKDEANHTNKSKNRNNSNESDGNGIKCDDGGCVSSEWFDSDTLEELGGASMSVVSCVSSTKLPFAYNQLLQFTTRIFMVVTTFFGYRTSAEQCISGNYQIPFTRFSWDDLPGGPPCQTYEYIHFNINNDPSNVFPFRLFKYVSITNSSLGEWTCFRILPRNR
jgi:hypothetical protein